MRSIWRRAVAVWLMAVLVPSLLGGGACLSHVLGASGSEAEHASHTVAAGSVDHSAHVADSNVASNVASSVASNVVLSVASNAGEMADAAPHDCCPEQGAPEHCNGASGCSAAASATLQRAPSALQIIAVLNRATSPLAPPGPANAPDVPPPRG